MEMVGIDRAGTGTHMTTLKHDDTLVTRFEVIDHRAEARESMRFGRVFGAHEAAVELSYQDGGRTLKVFISDREPAE